MSSATRARGTAYLAGCFGKKEEMREAGGAMEAAGFTLPCKWWDIEQKPAKDRTMKEHAAVGDAEIEASCKTDYFVCFLTEREYPYTGTLCELGLAIGAREMRAGSTVVVVVEEGQDAGNTLALRVPHLYKADGIVYVPANQRYKDSIAMVMKHMDGVCVTGEGIPTIVHAS